MVDHTTTILMDSSSRPSLLDHSSLDLSSTSAGPYRKRRRSLMTYVPALPPVFGALSHVHADLIPSPKRVRDNGYLADVEVGPRETRVERVTHLAIPKDIPELTQEGVVEVMYETLGDLVQRIVRVESTVIALTERVAKLERDNRRLRGTASVESQRVDRLQRGMSRMQREMRQMRRFRFYDRVRVGRLEACARKHDGLMKLMTEVYCLRNEVQKMETELWNLTVKGNDLTAYTQRFQELILLCTGMVPNEEDRVERFIGGLPDNIQRNGYVVRSAENKRRMKSNPRDNRGEKPPFKRQNTTGQNVIGAYTAGNNERKGYVVSFPYCNKCRLHHEGLCTIRCGNCKKIGYQTRDCRVTVNLNTQGAVVGNPQGIVCYKLRSQNLRNQTRNKTGNETGGNEVIEKAYAIGGGGTNPDSNVVMSTFLLNNCYTSMLFDSGVDRSFVLTTFSALLDVAPSTLDTSYTVKLADRRKVLAIEWITLAFWLALIDTEPVLQV
nr:hypothetical protein [Tanacetum cinerariifolium]